MEKFNEIETLINSLSIIAIKGILEMEFNEKSKLMVIESVIKDKNKLMELTNIKIKL